MADSPNDNVDKPSESTDGTDRSTGETDRNTSGTDGSTGDQVQQGVVSKILKFMNENKVEAALWFTRMFTLGATFFYLLPIWAHPINAYQKALISNAATSALRLHQRIPRIHLSLEFLSLIFQEDSAHYLMYSLIFLNSNPIFMVLVPVFLFAMLHVQSYTKHLLNLVGPNSGQFIRGIMGRIEPHHVNILRFIAVNEIFLMVATILAAFTGSGSLLMPFIYYRFLTLRYSSRRNPYCRQGFAELRAAVEDFTSRPGCPGFIRKMCEKAIAFICRLAPEVQAQRRDTHNTM